MNILDYTYDLHVLERKFSDVLSNKELSSFIRLIESEPSKEELLDGVFRFLNSVKGFYSADDVDDAYDKGFEACEAQYEG